MGFNRKQEIPPKITKAQLSVSTGNAVGYPLDGVNISPATTLSEYRKDIRWEVSRQANIGLDFSFFKDRLYGAFDA